MVTPLQQARYFNRHLSWLAFNRRVLEEAQDDRVPLLERSKFLGIVGSNLDEFCMARLASVVDHRHGSERDHSGLLPREQLEHVRREIARLTRDQYTCWKKQIEPALRRHGFSIVPSNLWTDEDESFLHRYYLDRIEPALTPLGVDPAHPFPLIANRALMIAVALEPAPGATQLHETEPGEWLRALVAVPSGRRLVALPGPSGRHALFEDIVERFLDSLFPGCQVTAKAKFRLTRDGSLDIDEDHPVDLLLEIEQELMVRAYGRPVRLEIDGAAPQPLRDWLVAALELESVDLHPISGPLDLGFLLGLPSHFYKPELVDPAHRPASPAIDDIFAAMREREIFLHHPYESFDPVVQLIEQSVDDDRVMAIKQTLYRVSGDSPVVRALIRAARAGKQVTVLLELKARFEEEANIRWARRLEEAGAHVIYGVLGYKVHAKLLLVIRRDEDGIRRYCQIGTGNYNDRTAKLYTDFSYFTCNEAVGRDVAALFNMLTGFAQPPVWERLAVAPLTLRRRFVEWIRREADHARSGHPARILAKFNSLVDPGICEELYAASGAGVEIDLVVRGMCILRPGVPGFSERIRVRSIIGRFLEHSRFYYFANHRDPLFAISSADWMTRNLDRRVEALVVIRDGRIQARLLNLFQIMLEDNAQARVLQPDGTYRRSRPDAGVPLLASQSRHMAEALSLHEHAEESAHGGGGVFTPLRQPTG